MIIQPVIDLRGAKLESFNFIDLFAGIGGIRQGFESIRGNCVFSSEWNKYSEITYKANYGDGEPFVGDITKFPSEKVPDHEVLLAGFPCQPFSIAGVSKNQSLGRATGFQHATQGTLFFNVADIIAKKQPSAFLLENVKNLVSHDKGNTFKVIMETLKDELEYNVTSKIIDAQYFVPQHRERIYIVGFKKDNDFSFDGIRYPEHKPTLRDILHPQDGSQPSEEPYTIGPRAKVNPKYTLSDNLWNYLQDYKERQNKRGNGFGYGLCTPDDVTRTLSARYGKDGSEILISQGEGINPRRLTPRECARLMGYTDSFKIPVSDTQAYRQFGNSVVVPVIKEIARLMYPYIGGK